MTADRSVNGVPQHLLDFRFLGLDPGMGSGAEEGEGWGRGGEEVPAGPGQGEGWGREGEGIPAGTGAGEGWGREGKGRRYQQGREGVGPGRGGGTSRGGGGLPAAAACLASWRVCSAPVRKREGTCAPLHAPSDVAPFLTALSFLHTEGHVMHVATAGTRDADSATERFPGN